MLHLCQKMTVATHTIVIDADASPSGFVAWYNHHSTQKKIIRSVRPAAKNQRMEMLAIYFDIADILKRTKREKNSCVCKKRL